MLARLNDCEQVNIALVKRVGRRDVSLKSAFSVGTVLDFSLRVPRSLGVIVPVLRLWRDGEGYTDRPFAFVTTDYASDVYALTLDTVKFSDADGGLFFYEFLFLRGLDTLFSVTSDNLHFTLKSQSGGAFALTLYRRDFTTPAWFHGATMYHVFVDRFKKGDGPVEAHGKLDADWDGGRVEYAEKNGMPLANDTFFGGNLWGVIEELDRLQKLGVTVLYLSPIFSSPSNHRYDTADYEHVDGLLGGNAAFKALCRAAHRKNMRVVLDGVFNHTGDDSRYFNKKKTFGDGGAYNDANSPYRDWYFLDEKGNYATWWGIDILPKLNQNDASCRAYFTDPENGILSRWLGKDGADGWRFDVVDELPDVFVDEARVAIKKTDGLLIGEVWENAAEKTAYGRRRRYFQGRQLDGVMNYPFRNAVLALLNRGDTEGFARTLTEIYSEYPETVCASLMNILSTHDTVRILTALGDGGSGDGLSNAELSRKRLSPDEMTDAVQKLKTGALIQYTVYGVPSLFYGDEAGLEGYHDPFCRRPYPYGHENAGLYAYYEKLGTARKRRSVLQNGTFRFLTVTADTVVYRRENADEILDVYVNVGDTVRTFTADGADFLSGKKVTAFKLNKNEAKAVVRLK